MKDAYKTRKFRITRKILVIGAERFTSDVSPPPLTPAPGDVDETTGGLLCGNSLFGIGDSRQVPNCTPLLPRLYFLPRLTSLISSLCDRSHCCVSSWHSVDKDVSSRHCICCHNDRSLCLRWSDRCFVCPLSLHRHSTRGSFCSCPLALLCPLILLISLLLLLLFLLIRETSTSLNIGKTERSPLPMLLSLVSHIVFARMIFPQV
jgi:hypothetical protein